MADDSLRGLTTDTSVLDTQTDQSRLSLTSPPAPSNMSDSANSTVKSSGTAVSYSRKELHLPIPLPFVLVLKKASDAASICGARASGGVQFHRTSRKTTLTPTESGAGRNLPTPEATLTFHPQPLTTHLT